MKTVVLLTKPHILFMNCDEIAAFRKDFHVNSDVSCEGEIFMVFADEALCDLSTIANPHKMDIPGRHSVEAFDRITRLAALVLKATASQLLLIEENAFSIRGCHDPNGIARLQTDFLLPTSSLQSALKRGMIASVEIQSDTSLSQNIKSDFLKHNPAARSFLIVTIFNQKHEPVGLLCAVDQKTHDWNTADIQALKDLACSVSKELEFLCMLRESERHKYQALNQHSVLEKLARGDDIHAVLNHLIYVTEELYPEMLTSILYYDPEKRVLRKGLSPRIPSSFTDAIDGLSIGPRAGSCGTAVFRRERVVVTDISKDSLWSEYKDLALPHGLRSCWSQPIFDSHNNILGTFAMYYRQPKSPSANDIESIERAAAIAGIAIERSLADRALKRAKDELQERVQERTEFLSTVLENLEDGIVACDESGRPHLLNRAAREFFGVPNSNIPPEQWPNYYSLFFSDGESPMDERDRPLLRALAGASVKNDEMVIKTKNQKLRYVSASGQPIFSKQGKKTGAVVVLHDITGRREAEAERSRLIQERIARSEAEAASAAKMSFLANMSHEIRTPMNAILGFTDILLASRLPRNDREDYLQRIRDNGDALLHLIDDILDLSKFEAGSVPVEKVKFQLIETVVETLKSLRPLAERKNIPLEIRCESPVPETVCSDPYRVRQVLVNLLSNAIKFSQQGPITISMNFIATDDSKKSGRIEIDVEDAGVGISASQQKSLFQPFSQADGTITRRFGGTGLGLALSQRLAQALGGNLTLKWSTPGKGSRFSFVFEVTDVDSPFVSSVPEPSKVSKKGPLARQMQSSLLKGLSILLAEDSPDNEALMRIYLQTEGAKVEVAHNGREALKLVRNRRDFDLILMDIQMPELDGLEATRQLRASGYVRPIIAITAHALKEEIDRSLAAGCNSHLTKPIKRSDLVREILAHTRGSLGHNENLS